MLGGLGIAGIIMGVLTLVEQGVVTATRAKALIEQANAESWTKEQWEAKLTELAEQSDSLYADTDAMLEALKTE